MPRTCLHGTILRSPKKLFKQVLDAKLIYAKILQNVKTQTF